MNGPVVLVLASGQGRRFIASGGSGSKLHAMLGHQTVLQHTLQAVTASGLSWHLEDAAHEGMGDSIAAAVRATSTAPGWLVLPGDLPLIQPATLRAVARAIGPHDVVVPVFEGRRGHPVGFAAGCGPGLALLKGNEGAALIVRAWAAIELIVDDAGAVTDIDTLADLAEARRRLTAVRGSDQARAAGG